MRTLAPLAVLALVLGGCAAAPDPATDDELTIVASMNVYGDLAETLAAGEAEVTSIIDDPSADPHQFEANGRVQLALSRADIVIVNGGGYDDFATTMLAASGNEHAVVITAVDESGLDAAAEGFNEHVWYDHATMQAVSARITAALIDAEPAGAERFAARAQALQGEFDALEQTALALRERTEGLAAVITEPVPGYLLRTLGIQDLTPPEFSEAIEEDADVPPALMQEVLNLLGDGSAQLVVYNAQTGGPQTDAVLDIASELRIPAIGVTETLPEGVGYTAWQAAYLDLIDRAVPAP